MTSLCYDEGSLSQQGSIKRFFWQHSTVSGRDNQMMFSTNYFNIKININLDYFVLKSAPLDLSTDAFPFETN